MKTRHQHSINLNQLARLPLILALIIISACTEKPEQQVISEIDITLNNRAVALMGRFEYAAAADIFSDLVERQPKWNEVRNNLAIALINRQQANDGESAMLQLTQVLENDAGNVRANYNAGVLQLYLGNVGLASNYFNAVLQADPTDAYAHYYLGQCQLRSGEANKALASYQQSIDLDPYLRSAYYSAAQVSRRLGKKKTAEKLLDLFQKFENNPRAKLAEFKYTRMGPMSLAQVIGDANQEISPSKEPSGELFSDQRVVAQYSIEDSTVESQTIAEQDDDVEENADVEQSAEAGEQAIHEQDIELDQQESELSLAQAMPHLTTVDYDRNGSQDVFITSGDGLNKVLVSTQGSNFVEHANHPWAEIPHINAVAWGDIDNNGFTDVYLCRTGVNQLWYQTSAGEWNAADESANIGGDEKHCSDATMVDADHDGDLDILIANLGAGDDLLNNNRDGSFRSLAEKLGDATQENDTQHLITTDLDSDNDVDLIFVGKDSPNVVLLNDRLWNYANSKVHAKLVKSDIASLAAADLDVDGQNELLSIDDKGLVSVWRVGEKGKWQASSLYQSMLGQNEGDDTDNKAQRAELVPLDLNGNGVMELAILTAGAFEVVEIDTTELAQWKATQLLLQRYSGSRAVPVTRSTHGSSLMAVSNDGSMRSLIEWPPGTGRGDYVTLSFSGKHDAADTMRSNHSGIGTKASVRSGVNWAVGDTHKHSSIAGYSLQPLSLGLAGHDKADFVAVDWSDGVYQTELDVDANSMHAISEEQRQLGSCPVLFTWDGTKYDFVTDILGVAAQGFLVEPGTLLPPRPWERVAFQPGKLAPKDGRIVFKVTEPMEENSYVDVMSLESFDLPNDWGMIVDERMATGAPEVTGAALFYRSELSPARAFDSAGNDVHALINERDQQAMSPGKIDPNYIGLLEEMESLTIEFDQAIDQSDDELELMPVLVADSWVELPYSQTHFSAWQAGKSFRSVSLEAKTSDGEWQMVYPEFGFPAGMPRTMSLPLADLPEGTTALRLSWNRQIYWDRIRVVYSEKPPVEMQHNRVIPQFAKVAKTGFYQRVNHDQRRPEYLYQQTKPFGDVEYPTGFYTNLGEMTELISEQDDALAIIGPGEEVHIEFELPEPAEQGLTRWYVLDTRGWAKDKDMYTHTGGSVAPLPHTNLAKNKTIRSRLHDKYNTRFQSGR